MYSLLYSWKALWISGDPLPASSPPTGAQQRDAAFPAIPQWVLPGHHPLHVVPLPRLLSRRHRPLQGHTRQGRSVTYPRSYCPYSSVSNFSNPEKILLLTLETIVINLLRNVATKRPKVIDKIRIFLSQMKETVLRDNAWLHHGLFRGLDQTRGLCSVYDYVNWTK